MIHDSCKCELYGYKGILSSLINTYRNTKILTSSVLVALLSKVNSRVTPVMDTSKNIISKMCITGQNIT